MAKFLENSLKDHGAPILRGRRTDLLKKSAFGIFAMKAIGKYRNNSRMLRAALNKYWKQHTHKTATTWPLTSYHTNHPSKTNKTYVSSMQTLDAVKKNYQEC